LDLLARGERSGERPKKKDPERRNQEPGTLASLKKSLRKNAKQRELAVSDEGRRKVKKEDGEKHKRRLPGKDAIRSERPLLTRSKNSLREKGGRASQLDPTRKEEREVYERGLVS